MIKPWIFEFFHAFEGDDIDDEAKIHDRYQRYLKMWTRDEELGFEGIFFSEHHFGPAYGPSPHLLIANMACRTKTLRLGTIGAVAGYMPP